MSLSLDKIWDGRTDGRTDRQTADNSLFFFEKYAKKEKKALLHDDLMTKAAMSPLWFCLPYP